MPQTSVNRGDEAAGGRSVQLLCAPADRGAAEEDAAAIRALGLTVTIASVDSPGAFEPPLPQLVVYLSRQARRGEARIEELLALAREPAQEPDRQLPEPVFVALDGSWLPARLPQEPLARHALPAVRYQRLLISGLLESLDRTGWNTRNDMASEEATRFLPSSLVISWGAGSTVIPPDFRGLVTIGRSPSCQITLESTFASRLHGCFRSDGEHYLYRDVSTNGSILYDGHEELLLHDEERPLPATGELKIGEVTVTFSLRQG